MSGTRETTGDRPGAALPARTERTITDPAALLRDLELSAVRGYTIDDEEDADGVFCVGAPVYDRTGGCVAAISGTGLKLNRPTWRMDELGIAIRDAADQITRHLGGPSFAARAGHGQVILDVSSAAFGGGDLSTLYITTARENFTPADLREQPQAGHIFACAPGVTGRPPFLFGR